MASIAPAVKSSSTGQANRVESGAATGAPSTTAAVAEFIRRSRDLERYVGVLPRNSGCSLILQGIQLNPVENSIDTENESHLTGLHVVSRSAIPLEGISLPAGSEEGAKAALISAFPNSTSIVAQEKIHTISDWIGVFIKARQPCKAKIVGECPKNVTVSSCHLVALMPDDVASYVPIHYGTKRFEVTFSWLSDGSAYGVLFLKHSNFNPRPCQIVNNHIEKKAWGHVTPIALEQHISQQMHPLFSIPLISSIVNQYLVNTLNTLTFLFQDSEPKATAVMSSASYPSSDDRKSSGFSYTVVGPSLDIAYKQDNETTSLWILENSFELARFSTYTAAISKVEDVSNAVTQLQRVYQTT